MTWIDQEYYYAVAQHKRGFPYYAAHDKTGLLITPYKYQSDAQRHLDNVEDTSHTALI